MNYDKIVLELLSRVQALEEQVVEIKAEITAKNKFCEDKCIKENKQRECTRSQARYEAIKIIKERYPDYSVDKACRKEGSGIKIIKQGLESKSHIIIKFFHSKIHGYGSGGTEHAWHTVNLNDIMETHVDLYMFSVVDPNGNWNFFMYGASELAKYNEKNRSGKSEILHLYFVVKDGKAAEIREGTIDVTDHLNNWDVLK